MNPQWAATLALLFACLPIVGQTPPTADVDRGLPTRPATTTPVPTGHRYVVAIGVDHYANPTWPTLSRAVSDAIGFSTVLQNQLGYELAASPITEKEATHQRIFSLIDDLYTKLKPGDDLVIFFAGHGMTRTNTIGPPQTGFLVPYDAPDQTAGRWSDYIEVDEFLNKINTLPATHILVILDSCHSGIALAEGIVKRGALEDYKRAMAAEIGRVVITSADSSEFAADSGGPLPNHSLFTGIIINGLKTGNADMLGQGFVTSSELGVFVNKQVGLHEGTKQHPRFGRFGSDDGGELLLPTSGDVRSFYTQAYAALIVNDRESFLRFAAKADALGSEAPQVLWIKYRERLQAGDFDGALKALNKLDDNYFAEPFSKDLLPFDISNIHTLVYRVAFWGNAVQLPAQQGIVAVHYGDSSAPIENGSVFRMPKGTSLRIAAQNVSPKDVCLGLISIDSSGSIDAHSIMRELDEMSVHPNKTATTAIMLPPQSMTLEFHLFVSPKVRSELVMPPSAMERGGLKQLKIEDGSQFTFTVIVE